MAQAASWRDREGFGASDSIKSSFHCPTLDAYNTWQVQGKAFSRDGDIAPQLPCLTLTRPQDDKDRQPLAASPGGSRKGRYGFM